MVYESHGKGKRPSWGRIGVLTLRKKLLRRCFGNGAEALQLSPLASPSAADCDRPTPSGTSEHPCSLRPPPDRHPGTTRPKSAELCTQGLMAVGPPFIPQRPMLANSDTTSAKSIGA